MAIIFGLRDVEIEVVEIEIIKIVVRLRVAGLE
jgi:hypothetical protein